MARHSRHLVILPVHRSLTYVCSLWRVVALRSWFCWVGIEVDAPRNAFPNGLSKDQFSQLMSSLKRGLEAHIERAQGRMLEIWVRSDPSTVAPHPKHWSKPNARDHQFRYQFFRSIGSTVQKYPNQIRTLCGMNEETQQILSRQNEAQLSRLTHLRVGCMSYSRPFDLPSLESMVIQGLSQQWGMYQISCPKLRSLSLMWKFNTRPRLDDRTTFTVLERFPTLENLTASFEIVFQRSGPYHHGIKHVNLLEGLGDCPLPSTANRIRTSEAVHKFVWCFPNIISFGSNSESIIDSLLKPYRVLTMEQLNLEGSVDLPTEILWQSSIRGLRRIRLGRLRSSSPFECEVTPLHPRVVKKVIDMLADRMAYDHPDIEPWNWPNLEKLELFEVGITKERATALVDMLRFRHQGEEAQTHQDCIQIPKGPQRCLLTLINCWLTMGDDHIPLPDGVDMDYPLASKTMGLVIDSLV
jgi:hypothetical protein